MHFPQKEIQKTIDEVWNSKKSNFYRKIWEKEGITEKPIISNEEGLKKIPAISRADLTSCPNPSDRLYIDRKDVEMLRNTSGTSKQDILYLWRDSFCPETYIWDKEAGARRVMVFFTPHFFMSAALAGRDAGMEMICGDPHNLTRSIKMLIQTNVNALLITPSLALIVGDALLKEKYGDKIDLLTLWGEHCSSSTREMIQKIFPNARLHFHYGTAESNDIIGFSTDACIYPEKTKHLREDFFYTEIIDEEVVITSLRLPNALPLIRYKTGDGARFIDEPCACKNIHTQIENFGRIRGDFVRIGGGELRIEEIDRVLHTFNAFIEPLFKVEVSEEKKGNNRIAKTHFFLTKKKGCTISDDSLCAKVTKTLLEELRLSQNMKLEEAVSAQLFAVPEVSFVLSHEINAKNPKIVYKQ